MDPVDDENELPPVDEGEDDVPLTDEIDEEPR